MIKSNQISDDQEPSLDEPSLDISSLIDVCFLLLIYFLVTTTLQPREQDLSTYTPVPSDGNLITVSPMLIEIRSNGEIVVNPGDAAELYETDVNSHSLPKLQERLAMLAGWALADTPKIVLKVHDEVKQQRYIDVINCFAGAGIRDIALID